METLARSEKEGGGEEEEDGVRQETTGRGESEGMKVESEGEMMRVIKMKGEKGKGKEEERGVKRRRQTEDDGGGGEEEEEEQHVATPSPVSGARVEDSNKGVKDEEERPANAVAGDVDVCPTAAPRVKRVGNVVSLPGGFPSLETFAVGDLVWAKSGRRAEPFWPGLIADPCIAPEDVQRYLEVDKLLVMFFGPSLSKTRERDFAWVKQGHVLDFEQYFDVQEQTLARGRGSRTAAYRLALEEALFWDRGGFVDSFAGPGARDDESEDGEDGDGMAFALQVRKDACTSCGARITGGKKATYAGGRCKSCHKLHRNGQFCRVCDRVWLPTSKDMVCCDKCGTWVHGECDDAARDAISGPEDAMYFCPFCRPKVLAMYNKEKPNAITASKLFAKEFADTMMEKDALESASDVSDANRAANEAWRGLSEKERDKYAVRAKRLRDEYSYLLKAVEKPKKKMAKPTTSRRRPKQKKIESINVVCNSVKGVFHVSSYQIVCGCSECASKVKWSPHKWEPHCRVARGRWKQTVHVDDEYHVKYNLPLMTLGEWIDIYTYDGKGNKPRPPWLPWRDKSLEPVKVQWMTDRCAVCDDDRDSEADLLITCSKCNMTVHKSCYGVVDDEDKMSTSWVCRTCENTYDDAAPPRCCLCPVEGGALKISTIPDVWVHINCSTWIPELCVRDVTKIEPIDQVYKIKPARWELPCQLCKRSMGAKIQCSTPGCYVSYHPLCAKIAGYHMEISVDANDAVRCISHCPRHSKPRLEYALARACQLPSVVEMGLRQKSNASGDDPLRIFSSDTPTTSRCVAMDEWVRCSHGKQVAPKQTPPTPTKSPAKGKVSPSKKASSSSAKTKEPVIRVGLEVKGNGDNDDAAANGDAGDHVSVSLRIAEDEDKARRGGEKATKSLTAPTTTVAEAEDNEEGRGKKGGATNEAAGGDDGGVPVSLFYDEYAETAKDYPPAEWVGCRLEIYWPLDEVWYSGKITSFNKSNKRHRILYDDGESEIVSLRKESFRWILPPRRRKKTARFGVAPEPASTTPEIAAPEPAETALCPPPPPAAAAADETANPPDEQAGEKPTDISEEEPRTEEEEAGEKKIPDRIALTLGGVIGEFNVPKLQITCFCATCSSSSEPKPFPLSEWQWHLGLPVSQSWKSSVKLLSKDGSSAAPKSVGDWLVEHKIEIEEKESYFALPDFDDTSLPENSVQATLIMKRQYIQTLPAIVRSLRNPEHVPPLSRFHKPHEWYKNVKEYAADAAREAGDSHALNLQSFIDPDGWQAAKKTGENAADQIESQTEHKEQQQKRDVDPEIAKLVRDSIMAIDVKSPPRLERKIASPEQQHERQHKKRIGSLQSGLVRGDMMVKGFLRHAVRERWVKSFVCVHVDDHRAMFDVANLIVLCRCSQCVAAFQSVHASPAPVAPAAPLVVAPPSSHAVADAEGMYATGGGESGGEDVGREMSASHEQQDVNLERVDVKRGGKGTVMVGNEKVLVSMVKHNGVMRTPVRFVVHAGKSTWVGRKWREESLTVDSSDVESVPAGTPSKVSIMKWLDLQLRLVPDIEAKLLQFESAAGTNGANVTESKDNPIATPALYQAGMTNGCGEGAFFPPLPPPAPLPPPPPPPPPLPPPLHQNGSIIQHPYAPVNGTASAELSTLMMMQRRAQQFQMYQFLQQRMMQIAEWQQQQQQQQAVEGQSVDYTALERELFQFWLQQQEHQFPTQMPGMVMPGAAGNVPGISAPIATFPGTLPQSLPPCSPFIDPRTVAGSSGVAHQTSGVPGTPFPAAVTSSIEPDDLVVPQETKGDGGEANMVPEQAQQQLPQQQQQLPQQQQQQQEPVVQVKEPKKEEDGREAAMQVYGGYTHMIQNGHTEKIETAAAQVSPPAPHPPLPVANASPSKPSSVEVPGSFQTPPRCAPATEYEGPESITKADEGVTPAVELTDKAVFERDWKGTVHARSVDSAANHPDAVMAKTVYVDKEKGEYEVLVTEKVAAKMAVDEASDHVSVTLKVIRRTRRKYKVKPRVQKQSKKEVHTKKEEKKKEVEEEEEEEEDTMEPEGCTTPVKVDREIVEQNRINAVNAVSAQLVKLRDAESQRLAFGKSAIQGWGLIAQQNFKESDFVIEYRGQLVRHSVANILEEKYAKAGKACYLFAVDDDYVVDATDCGNLGRFINHSCNPNMHTKVVKGNKGFHIVFVARRDVSIGEELTFDYRFEKDSEEGAERIPCFCGAPTCRGYMN